MAAASGGSATDLARGTEQLVGRLKGVNPGWYEARTDGPAGEHRPRREHLRSLVVALAALGRECGSGAPPGAVPPELGLHALGDQVTVLVADLAGLPGGIPPRAAELVEECYGALWVAR